MSDKSWYEQTEEAEALEKRERLAADVASISDHAATRIGAISSTAPTTVDRRSIQRRGEALRFWLTREQSHSLVGDIHNAAISDILFFVATLLQDIQMHRAPPLANAPESFKQAMMKAQIEAMDLLSKINIESSNRRGPKQMRVQLPPPIKQERPPSRRRQPRKPKEVMTANPPIPEGDPEILIIHPSDDKGSKS